MPLVNAKCTNCGGSLQVNSEEDAMVCPYCGSAFVVEKAIHNYNINVVHQNTIQANTVNIYTKENDFEIRAGVLIKYHGEATEVVVPENVFSIGGEAFANCTYLEKVILPSKLKMIELPNPNASEENRTGAFYNCLSLKEIKFPDTLTHIEDNAFAYCESLKEVRLPSSLKEIGNAAFLCCKSLKSIHFPESIERIYPNAFQDCTALEQITLPSRLEKLEQNTFSYCSSLQEVVLPNSIKTLCGYVFYNCSSLRKITMSSYLAETVRYDNFVNCFALKELAIIADNHSPNYNLCNSPFFDLPLEKIFFTGTLEDWINSGFSGFNRAYNTNLYLNGKLVSGEVILPEKLSERTFTQTRCFINYTKINTFYYPKAMGTPTTCLCCKNKINFTLKCKICNITYKKYK